MPRAPRVTYADRVNCYLCVENLDTFNIDDLIDQIVRGMETRGEPVTRCTRGCIRAYFQSLRVQRVLSKHPSREGLVQPSEKFRRAIDRIRNSEVELDYSNITRISSLLRVAAGRMKSLTARELRDRVIELLDELEAMRAEFNALKKEHEDLQVDYGMVREERDEYRTENLDLKAKNTHLQAVIDELVASRNSNAAPTRESSSANMTDFHTAPSSPQLSHQPAGGPLSRVPTEIFPPATPPRASISRNPSGLPTPPTTDARPPDRRPSRTDSRSGSSSHRSFRENTPGAASVRGATPGSPSRRHGPHRHSPPLRQLSSQNHTSPGGRSGLAREPSFSDVLAPIRDYERFVQEQFDEQRVRIARIKEQAVQRARAQHIKHEELVRRQRALEDERRRVQEELAGVRGQLGRLEEQHRATTQEHQKLVARYTKLCTRVETLNKTIKDLASEAATLLDEHNVPVTGTTATGGAA